MRRRLIIWVVLFLLSTLSVLGAVDAWRITAHLGTEADLEQEVIVYYGDKDHPVEAVTEDMRITGEYLEYRRKEALFVAKGNIELTQEQPKFRRLTAAEVTYNTENGDIAMPLGGQIRFGPEKADFKADKITGNINREVFSARGNCVLANQDGVLTAEEMDGNLVNGNLTAQKQVVFKGHSILAKGGLVVYYQKEGHIVFRENPWVSRGKEVFTAQEIIYDIKTKKIKAKGPVEYKSGPAATGGAK